MHPDGYIQLKDRSKDIIISGGENISSIEVEDALYKHPAVASCGVVARPDEKWGEMPVAYVELKPGTTATEDEIIEHCRTLLARFKVPEGGDFRRDPEDLDRQDPEIPAAGTWQESCWRISAGRRMPSVNRSVLQASRRRHIPKHSGRTRTSRRAIRGVHVGGPVLPDANSSNGGLHARRCTKFLHAGHHLRVCGMALGLHMSITHDHARCRSTRIRWWRAG